MPKLTNICGFRLLAMRYSECVDLLLARLNDNQGAWVLTLNLEILSNARLHPEYRDLVQSADIVLADGMPFVWASSIKRGAHKIPERSTGADISADLILRYPASKIAIIGGENPPKALEALKIEHRNEAFVFDGAVSTDPEVVQKLITDVKAHGARLIFMALGVPKQDYMAAEFRNAIPEAVILGVGGTFELIAGIKPRAPIWMRRSGMEWLFRLYNEPRRLWRRYLVLYWAGVWSLFLDVFRRSPEPTDKSSAIQP